MSIFKGPSKAASAAVTPDFIGLQIQTAVNALPIPIVWGISKLAPNVIWYNGFLAIPTTSSGGGGGKGLGGGGPSSTTGYNYYADVIMALCEGPIAGIDKIWRGQSLWTLSGLGLSLALGTTPQTVWSFLTATFPQQALAYQGTAYVFAANYDLTDSATLDNHNFEVLGFFQGTGANGIDADPAQVIYDFLTNAQYGVAAPNGFPVASIDLATLFGSGGDASLQTYCLAVGICLSPALTDQETASSILARWLNLCNCAAVYSGGQLRFIPYGDTAIPGGTVTATTSQIEIPPLVDSATLTQLIAMAQAAGPTYASLVSQLQAQLALGAGGTTLAITVIGAARFVADLGVAYDISNTPLTYIGANCPAAVGTYGIGPGGTYLFYLNDAQAVVNISYQYSAAAAFVPNVTPIYDLDDDDFKVEDNEDPLQVSRSDPYEAYNVWRVEVAERANAYNLTPIESRDQNAIELYGMRIAPTVTAHEICDPNVGLISGQLMLQRALYIRNTYKFQLSWEYCLLDPMDLVTVTDSILGLSKAPIRITDIEEDDNGFLQVSAEEFPLGVATATLYPGQTNNPAPIDRNVPADPVNAPVIFEPPAALAGATPQIWIAASGGLSGVADPNWGGANVWLSVDLGNTYEQIGVIGAPAKQGSLTASLASYGGTNPDTTDTLAVNLAESGGALTSVSALAAQLGTTLCIVDKELLSFQTATLTSANHYALTALWRGLYGTTIAAHASGAQFARLDSAVFQYGLPAQFAGVELMIKLQSFNVFGGGMQALSACTAYAYTPSGNAFSHPVAEAMLAGVPLDFGSVTVAPNAEDDFGTPFTMPLDFDVDLGAA